jgi:hypothetical protein
MVKWLKMENGEPPFYMKVVLNMKRYNIWNNGIIDPVRELE